MGRADRGRWVTSAIRSIPSSTVAGPTEQFSPTTSVRRHPSAPAASSTDVPQGGPVFPLLPHVTWANMGRSVAAFTAATATFSSSISAKVSRMRPSTPPSRSPWIWRPKRAAASSFEVGPHGSIAEPQRPHRAQHQRPASPAALPGDLRRRPVDLLGASLQPVGGQLHRVRAEGVGLDEARRRRGGTSRGPGATRSGCERLSSLVAHIHEHALGVEYGAHGAVQEVGPRPSSMKFPEGHGVSFPPRRQGRWPRGSRWANGGGR